MLTCWRLSQPATSSQGLTALLLGPRAPSIFCEAPSPPRQQMQWKSVFPEAQLLSSIHHSADLFFVTKSCVSFHSGLSTFRFSRVAELLCDLER